MPGHTPFCEIQCIRLTINKAILKYNPGDLEEIIFFLKKREERETKEKRNFVRKKGRLMVVWKEISEV